MENYVIAELEIVTIANNDVNNASIPSDWTPSDNELTPDWHLG